MKSIITIMLGAALALLSACSSVPQTNGHYFTRLEGNSNGRALMIEGVPDNMPRFVAGYDFAKLGDRPNIFPVVEVNGVLYTHPIVGGNARDGYVTKGKNNLQADPVRLTEANFRGVISTPGLDPLALR